MGKRTLIEGIFLDRDGVLNRPLVRDGKPYPPSSLEAFEWLPGVQEACERMAARDWPLVVVTNQPDVARGTMDREVVESIHRKILAELPIARIEVCYEDGRNPESKFYKPAIGMLTRAADELGLDLRKCVMIGDRWRDIDCGRAAGCLTIWINHGYLEVLKEQPHYSVNSLLEASLLLETLEIL